MKKIVVILNIAIMLMTSIPDAIGTSSYMEFDKVNGQTTSEVSNEKTSSLNELLTNDKMECCYMKKVYRPRHMETCE